METNDPDRPNDRAALIGFCPLLAAGLIFLYRGLSPFLKQSPDRALQICGLIFEEIVIASVCFLSLAFLWACFQPEWLEKPLTFISTHVFHIFFAMVLFLFVFCPLATLFMEFVFKKL